LRLGTAGVRTRCDAGRSAAAAIAEGAAASQQSAAGLLTRAPVSRCTQSHSLFPPPPARSLSSLLSLPRLTLSRSHAGDCGDAAARPCQHRDGAVRAGRTCAVSINRRRQRAQLLGTAQAQHGHCSRACDVQVGRRTGVKRHRGGFVRPPVHAVSQHGAGGRPRRQLGACVPLARPSLWEDVSSKTAAARPLDPISSVSTPLQRQLTRRAVCGRRRSSTTHDREGAGRPTFSSHATSCWPPPRSPPRSRRTWRVIPRRSPRRHRCCRCRTGPHGRAPPARRSPQRQSNNPRRRHRAGRRARRGVRARLERC